MNMHPVRVRKVDQSVAQAEPGAGIDEHECRDRIRDIEWHNRVAELLRPFAECASLLV